MEEAEEILLGSLSSSGVSIPSGSTSIGGLTTADLLSICAASLPLIAGDGGSSPPSVPDPLPDSTMDRFKICSDVASALRSAGFPPDLSFHQFLYPSKEESYKIVRFVVEKLSQTSSGRGSLRDDENGVDNRGLRKTVHVEPSVCECDGSGMPFTEVSGICDRITRAGEPSVLVDDVVVSQNVKLEGFERSVERGRDEFIDELEWKVASLFEEPAKDLKEEMTFDGQHSIEYYFEELNKRIEEKKNYLEELDSKWNASKNSLEERRESLLQKLCDRYPERLEMLLRVKEVEKEIKATIAEIREREEEHSELSMELKKQPKLPSRKSYVQRVIEITKNIRKQDADIERIMKDTRQLQLESNSIQERLHRTYTVVDETVFRNAKKDPVGRQAYRLLTSMHDSFEQISDKILAMDRVRREATEVEAKLAAIALHGGLDVNKLQSDLDAIRRENELLELQVHPN
ncbi:hypothetical protein QJS10_CPB15g00972 [Acorus calamus]|uniref:Coiled-coil domain-containing protein 22 homolog n=1 Tax=Acorus calamus TaxID=4465 RepID=A0AAV9D5B7_ACOCL|nr:hypothetical protein QJS10_CPB15g00972 [Acorus calamus]